MSLVAAQAVLTFALCTASVREALWRAPMLFLVPFSQTWRAPALVAVVAGSVAAFAAYRCRATASLAALCLALSGTLSALAPAAWAFAFADHTRFSWLPPILVALSAAALAAVVVASVRWLSSHARALGVLSYLLAPFPLASAALCVALALGATAQLPLLHAGASLGACFALLAFAPRALQGYLAQERRSSWAAALPPAAALLLGLAMFAHAERSVPIAEARAYGGELVLAAGGERQRLALVSYRSHFELYVDRTMKFSSIDAHRYSEALVHPALSSSLRPARVLLLGGGTGLLEREALRYESVTELTVVVTDRTLPDWARRSPWLRSASAAALDDPRVRVVEAEPMLWLVHNRERFDALVIDLEDPASYREGKHYTRRFYELCSAALEQGGIAALQAPSPLTFPRAFASIAATLEAAQLPNAAYQAPLPAVGVGGFFLFAHSKERVANATGRQRDLPRGLRFLTAAGLPALFHLPADATLKRGAPNTLFSQPVVELYAEEHARRAR